MYNVISVPLNRLCRNAVIRTDVRYVRFFCRHPTGMPEFDVEAAIQANAHTHTHTSLCHAQCAFGQW